MILSIGEILFDMFPDYKRLGGAPFNFAFHVKQLGVPVVFFSRVGNDPEGHEIFETISRYGFDTSFLQTDDYFETGKVLIDTDEKGVPSFNILRHMAYDNLSVSDSVTRMLDEPIDLLYVGTLAQRGINGFATIQHVLDSLQPSTKVLYDVNLRPHCYSKSIIVDTLKYTHILKISEEEVYVIKEMLAFNHSNEAFIERLIKEFSIELVAITKGAEGSEIVTKETHISHSASKADTVIDTVGAGDAYAAMLAIGCLKNWDLNKIIAVASDFSGEICKIEGAIPENTRLYKNYKYNV